MRSLGTTFLAVILVGMSIAEDQVPVLYQGCWKSNLPDDGVTNSISFCIRGDSVEATVFYPNREDPPTTCRSHGSVKSTGPNLLLIRTKQGVCENGRTLAAAHLTCTLLGENELSCLHPDSKQVHLVREGFFDRGLP